MASRLPKQIFYGAIFLIFFGALFAGGYFLFFGAPPGCFDNKQNQDEAGVDCGGVCGVLCEIKNARPLESGLISLSAFGKSSAVVAEIKNPNLEVGAVFSYVLKLSSSDGSRSKEIYGDSFVYAGEVKRIVEVLPEGGSYGQRALEFSDVIWKPAGDFKKPEVQLLSQKTELRNIGAEIISGILARNLALNDQGDDVKLLQTFLAYNKFYAKEISGKFDAETKKALTAYQKAKKISPANGALGTQTRQVINAEISTIKDLLPPLADVFPVSVSGVVQNGGVLSLSKIVINVFVYNKSGVLAGVSKTELENLEAGETREFRVPLSSEISPDLINPNATKIDVYAL